MHFSFHFSISEASLFFSSGFPVSSIARLDFVVCCHCFPALDLLLLHSSPSCNFSLVAKVVF